MTQKPENPVQFTTQMSAHLNLGSNGHGYIYNVFADGRLIGTRGIRTGKEKSDLLIIGDEEFDVAKNGKDAAHKWLTERAKHVGDGEWKCNN